MQSGCAACTRVLCQQSVLVYLALGESSGFLDTLADFLMVFPETPIAAEESCELSENNE